MKTIKTNAITHLLISILLFFMVGCSQITDDIQLKKIEIIETKATINVIGHWLAEGDREVLVRNFAREYEFKNQHISVNLKFPEEVYFDKLDRASDEKFVAKSAVSANPEWDVIKVNGQYGEVKNLLNDPDWAKKHLVDFSQIEEFRNGTRPELLSDEMKKAWNGIIPGPYLEGQYWSLWCNVKVAQKLGIEVKQTGMTVDDFTGYLKVCYEYNQKNPDDYIMPIYESYVWTTALLIAIQMYSSLLTADEFLSSEVTEKRLDAWGKTLDAIEKMAKYKPLNPKWKETEWSQSMGHLINDKSLFLVNGSWMYNIWQGIDEERIFRAMPTEFPSFNKFPVYPGAYIVTWAVLKNSPNREAAIDFLLEMNKPGMADTWVRSTKCPSGIKGSLADVTFGGDQFENFSSYIQQTYTQNQYRYFPSGHWVLDNRFPQGESLYFAEVIEGKLTAKEAMNKIRRAVGR